MSHTTKIQQLRKAFILSIWINLALILVSFLPVQQIKSIACILAAPTTPFANRFFVPQQHTVSAFLLAASESLLCSIVIYTMLAWIVLSIASRLKQSLNKKADTTP
jgi:hypothetical protein